MINYYYNIAIKLLENYETIITIREILKELWLLEYKYVILQLFLHILLWDNICSRINIFQITILRSVKFYTIFVYNYEKILK